MKTSRRLLTGLLTIVLAAPAPPAPANPVGEVLQAGSATFNRSRPGQLVINQGSHRAIINWADFSIARGEVTSFVMPSASAAVLNRVVGVNPSQIFGTLRGNGHVYVINPNGILVGRDGVVNTRSLTASTLDVSDAAFLAGAGLRFSGPSTATVQNDGQISALGGDVFLIGHRVDNSGVIEARQGKVGLAAGSEIILQPAGDDRLSVVAGNASARKDGKGVNNVGTIEAVAAELKAAGGNIYSLAINNGGVIRATGVRHENGRVVLVAGGGDIENSGVLSAQNADGSGGSITLDAGRNANAPATLLNSGIISARGEAAGTRGGEVKLLGEHIGLGDGALIDVSGQAGGGTALIGGDAHGANLAVPNAQRTFVGAGAEIRADALSRGNGGRVIVWADDVTRFFGRISARGGERGGHGGFAEVSGKQSLVYAGTSDLRAPRGRIGRLLLDPKNITVSDAGDPFVAGDYDFSDNSSASVTILNTGPNSLVAALELADVTLQANNDITISAAIDTSGNTADHNLTLQAGRSIVLDADIFLRGSLTAVANYAGADLVSAERDTGAAAVTMAVGVEINTGFNGAHDISLSFGTAASAGDMTLRDLTSGGGAITASALFDSTANAGAGNTLALLGAVDSHSPAASDGSVSLSAGRLQLGGSIRTDGGEVTITALNDRSIGLGATPGDLTISGVQLAGITTAGGLRLVTTGAGGITVDGITAGDSANVIGPLTLDAGGAVNFSGGASAFHSLVADAGASLNLGANVSTIGNQTYHDTLDLSADVILAGAGLTLAAVTGNEHDLTLNFSGNTLIDGQNFTGLKNLTTGGGGATLLDGGTITTSGNQTYLDAVELQSATTVQAVDIRLGSVDGAGQGLTLSGSGVTTLAGAVSGVSEFKSDSGGSTVLSGGSVTSTGLQQYDDDVRLGMDATLTASGVFFNGTLDSAAGTLHSLRVNSPGTTGFIGPVGANDRLSSLTTDAPGMTFLGSSIKLNGAGATFNDQVLLTADVVFDESGPGNVTFNHTVDSLAGNNFALTVNTPGGGNTVFNGAVGADSLDLFSDGNGLGALTTDAAGKTAINGGTVTTFGHQTYHDAVTLGADAALTALNNADVTFSGTLDSAAGTMRSLTVNASGVTKFNGAIGGIDKLSSLTTDAGGRTELGAAMVRLNGASTVFNDAVLLIGDVTIEEAGAGDLIFRETVDSATGSSRSLTVNTPGGGATIFNGTVGNDALGALSEDDGLNNLTTDAAGATRLDGGIVRTTGHQTYHDTVTLGVDNTLFGINVLFEGTVDSAPSTAQSLSVMANGTTRFHGAVGGSDRLASLTTDAAGRTEIGGGSVNLGGPATFGDALLLTSGLTINNVAPGDVTFNGTVDSAAGANHALTVNTSGGGNTIFNGAVGSDALGALSSDTGLGSLATDATGVTLLNGATVRTTGNQDYSDAVRLGANATLSGADVTFRGTINSAAGQLRSLTVNGSGVTTFAGAVGGVDRLASLTTDAPGRTEIGAGVINLNGAAASAFNDAVLLNADLVLDQSGAGSVAFNSVLDSRLGANHALRVNTSGGGDTVFGGLVGGDAHHGFGFSDAGGLGSLTTDGVGRTLLNGMLVRTTGAQTFADVMTLGAAVELEASSVTLNKVTGTGWNLTVKADDVALTPGQEIAVAKLTLQPRSASRVISLGTERLFRLSLTQAELSTVKAAVLQIGSINGEWIFLTSPITLASDRVPTLRLETAGSIDGTAGGLAVASLAIDAGLNVRLTGENSIGTIAARFGRSGTPDFSLCNLVDLTVGSVDGLSGIVAGDGTAATHGTITLLADNLRISHSINAGSGDVSLNTKTGGRGINLGTETEGQLSLTAVELGRITADTLKIGGAAAGVITVSAGLDFEVNSSAPRLGTLSLESARGIFETEDGWIQVKNLALRSRSQDGALLNNPMNNVRRLGAALAGPLVFNDPDGFAPASTPPNEVDGLTGVNSSTFDLQHAALSAVAAVSYVNTPGVRATDAPVESVAPDAAPAGLGDPGTLWTSHLQLPLSTDSGRKHQQIEQQPKWSTGSKSRRTSYPFSPPR